MPAVAFFGGLLFFFSPCLSPLSLRGKEGESFYKILASQIGLAVRSAMGMNNVLFFPSSSALPFAVSTRFSAMLIIKL